jgi:hypothetical protein
VRPTMRSGSRTSAVIHRNTDVFRGRVVRRLLLSSTFRGGLRRDAVVAVVQTADLWDGDNASG